MDFIFTIITAVVIATSAGGAVNTMNGGDEVGPPPSVVTDDQSVPTQCYAPCTYDPSTDTYYCPC